MSIHFNPNAMNQIVGHPLDPSQLKMLSVQYNQLHHLVEKFQQDLQNYKNNHATPEQIDALKKNYQGMIDRLLPGFKDQLKRMGVNPSKIDALLKELKIEAGVDDGGSTKTPTQLFIEKLTAWENSPGKTQAEKDIAKSILDKVKPDMSPETLQSFLTAFFNAKLLGTKDIYAQFPGITKPDLQAIADMLPGYPIKVPDPSNVNPVNPTNSIGYAGSALFNYVNHSGMPDDQVYIQVIGEDPITKQQCFIKYKADGTFDYIPAKPGMNSQDYAFPLSFFPKSGEGRGVHLPPGGGMRMYTSIGSPLHFKPTPELDKHEKPTGRILIEHPDPHNPSGPDWKTRWDKVEFNVDWGSLLSEGIASGKIKTQADLDKFLKVENLKNHAHKGVVFINPTAVDGFSLPFEVAATRHGGSNTQPGSKRPEEGGITASPKKVFADFEAAINNIPSSGDAKRDAYLKEQWQRLLIGDGDAKRLLSPMDASQTGHFDPDFFSESGWMYQFKKVYSNQPLLIDMKEGYPEGRAERGIWEMKVNPDNTLTFTNKNGGPFSPITLKMPAKPPEGVSDNPARDILSGTGPGWGLDPDLNSPKRKLQDALIRNFSVAIETNTLTTKLPMKAADGSTIEGIGQKYFSEMRNAHPSHFYAKNAEDGPQFYNVYSQTLHANAIDGQVYTHAYDDEGTQSGAAAFTIEEFEKGTIVLGPLT